MKKETITYKLGELTQKIKDLENHFTNHLSKHWRHDLFTLIQTIIIIGMFCYLKWSR